MFKNISNNRFMLSSLITGIVFGTIIGKHLYRMININHIHHYRIRSREK